MRDVRIVDGAVVTLGAPASAVETAQEGVPGEWVCDCCGFHLATRTLHAPSGNVSIRGIVQAQSCPNDGTPLRSQTWRELAESYRGAMDDYSNQLAALTSEVRTLREERKLTDAALGAYLAMDEKAVEGAMFVLRAARLASPSPTGAPNDAR